MKILVDMNLSPRWVDILNDAGHEACHWSKIGNPRAPDLELVAWALAHHAVVFTHDLDFGILVAMAGELGPSIMQARTHATTRPDREQIPDRPRIGSRCSASSKPRHPTRHPRRAVIASDRQRSWVDVFVGASRARRGRRRALGFAVVSSP